MCLHCSLDVLHANLYLGFGRNMEDPGLYHLWHDDNLNATAFLDAANPAAGTVQRTSLFSLGGMVVAAAKEVQFAALNPTAAQQPGPVANMRAFRFLQANGPGTMYTPYMKSLDAMVSHPGLQLALRAVRVRFENNNSLLCWMQKR